MCGSSSGGGSSSGMGGFGGWGPAAQARSRGGFNTGPGGYGWGGSGNDSIGAGSGSDPVVQQPQQALGGQTGTGQEPAGQAVAPAGAPGIEQGMQQRSASEARRADRARAAMANAPEGVTYAGVSDYGVRREVDETFGQALARKASDPFGESSMLGTAVGMLGTLLGVPGAGIAGEALDAAVNPKSVQQPGYSAPGVPFDAPEGVTGVRTAGDGYVTMAQMRDQRLAEQRQTPTTSLASVVSGSGPGWSGGRDDPMKPKLTADATQAQSPAEQPAPASTTTQSKRTPTTKYTGPRGLWDTDPTLLFARLYGRR